MENIKAIETEYKGYRFRSRLEARWAVFFEGMGIDYEYELEGFELEEGRYLPDFYLPKINVFVEIKPTATHINIYDLKRYDELAIINNKALLLIIGSPLKQEFLIIDRRTSYPLQDIIEELASGTTDAGIVCEYIGRLRELGRVGFGFVPGHNPRSLIYWVESADPWTQLCLEKARQARFEFEGRAR